MSEEESFVSHDSKFQQLLRKTVAKGYGLCINCIDYEKDLYAIEPIPKSNELPETVKHLQSQIDVLKQENSRLFVERESLVSLLQVLFGKNK